jgi:hypothetical protein
MRSLGPRFRGDDEPGVPAIETKGAVAPRTELTVRK